MKQVYFYYKNKEQKRLKVNPTYAHNNKIMFFSSNSKKTGHDNQSCIYITTN